MHNAALTTISPSMVTLGADMRRDIVRLGAIFPPPSAPPPLLRCFISTELPSTAPADFRQAQQFPILCLECTGLSGRCSFAAAAVRRHAGSDTSTGGSVGGRPVAITAPRHAVFDLRSFRPIGASYAVPHFQPKGGGDNKQAMNRAIFSLLAGAMGPPGPGDDGPGGSGGADEPEDAVSCP